MNERLRRLGDMFGKVGWKILGRGYQGSDDKTLLKHGKMPSVDLGPGEQVSAPGVRVWADEEGNVYQETDR